MSIRALPVLSLLMLLSACAAPSPLAYQAQAANGGYGYSQARIDATHYSLLYADNNQAGADAHLERRAAELAKMAGYPAFVFVKRGGDEIRSTTSDLVDPGQLRPNVGRQNTAPSDYLPEVQPVATLIYYRAFGQIALLSADEAKANAQAMNADAVLAR